MTALGMIFALAAAVWIGYRWGRRAATPPPSWHSRTRRSALGRQAITLLALVTASQIQRSIDRRLRGSDVRRTLLAWAAALPLRR